MENDIYIYCGKKRQSTPAHRLKTEILFLAVTPLIYLLRHFFTRLNIFLSSGNEHLWVVFVCRLDGRKISYEDYCAPAIVSCLLKSQK